MFQGYAQFGGTEIVNAARVKAYIDNNMPSFPLKNCADCGDLREAVGDEAYESPLVDDAPWYDPANPATGKFYGLYPLSMEGFEDDTRAGTATENIGDGGFVGGVRAGSRQMRIHGVLVGEDEDAVSSGLSWLKAALSPAPCADGNCGGSSLCWYSACPIVLEGCYDESAGGVGSSLQTGPVLVNRGTSFNAPTIDAKYTLVWVFPQTDGVIFRYGLHTKAGDPISEFGPYVSARTNYMVNPNFTTNTAGWSVATGTLVWNATGGVDDTFARATPTAGSVTVQSSVLDATFGIATASIALRSAAGAAVTMSVIDNNTGTVLATQVVNPTADWQRYYLTAPNGRQVYVKLVGNGVFDIDRALIEHSEASLPYFDSTVHPLPLPTSKMEDYEFSVTSGGFPRMEWIGQTYVDLYEHSAIYPAICGNDWIASLSVDAGSFETSMMLWGGIGLVDGPTQGERWERTFHEVTVISGPTVIADYPLQNGSAKEIEFILVAGSPFAYGVTNDIMTYEPVTGLETASWDDAGWLLSRNSVLDPVVASIANFTASVAGGAATIARDVTPVPAGLPTNWVGAFAKATVTTAGTYVDLRNIRTLLPVQGGDIRSFAVYGLENAPIAGATIQTLVVFYDGAGIQVGLTTTTAQATPLSTTSWTRYKTENIVVPIGAVGASIILRENAASVPIGHILWATGFQSNIGVTATATVSGGFTDTASRNYVWEGVANASPSRMYRNFQCAVDPSTAPIFDPSCPQPPVKPTAPVVKNTCLTTPTEWKRYYLEIGPQEVSAWNQTVPTFGVTSKSTAVRSIRVRFYPNPFGYDPSQVDPCSYCSEFILSYIPANTDVVIDGTVQRASASVGGGAAQPASNLLYGTDGAPMSWPSLSCGVPYAVTIDTPPDAPSDLTVSLALTRQE